MFRYCWAAAVMSVLLCASMNPAYAQLQGEYYRSSTAGEFTTRVDTVWDDAIQFEWGNYAPEGVLALDANLFTVRWRGQIAIPAAGNWTFYTRTDDGARLYIDDTLVVDQWVNQSPTEASGDITLTAGLHDLKMEYYENTGGAVAQLSWEGPGTAKALIPATAFSLPSHGLWARYDADEDPLTGGAAVLRNDATVDFNWGSKAPEAAVPADSFSVRWSGLVTAPGTGTFTFYVESDDGNELWVDGRLLIDDLAVNHSAAELSGAIDLVSGESYPIDLRFRERGGDAICRLRWEGPGIAEKQAVPESALTPKEFLVVNPAEGPDGQLNRIAAFDQSTTFRVEVYGAQGIPGYQWYFKPEGDTDAAPFTGTGANTDTVTLFSITPADAGVYTCEVTDEVESTVSPEFRLQVVMLLPATGTAGLAALALILAMAGKRFAARRK